MWYYQFKKGTLVRHKGTRTFAVVLKEPQATDFSVLVHYMDENLKFVKTRPVPIDRFELVAEGR
tara:strand:+ start:246 stop:437 length:192 start_codon:yes stop_codon:yes gene_type:complete